jgi:hypothetical protein
MSEDQNNIVIEDETESEETYVANKQVMDAKSFLENIEDELVEDVKTQVKSGLQDFTALLSDLELDPRLASLWKLIYANAMTDRKNAFALWLDLYVKTFNNEENHFKHGQTLTKYMEMMSKSNQQLLKLAELVDNARTQYEIKQDDNIAAHFFGKKQSSAILEIKKKK